MKCECCGQERIPPDDGEAVTPEWVKSISPSGNHLFPFGDGCDVWFVFNAQGGYMVISDGVNHQAELATPPTRGHIRRLLVALGVKL